VTNPQLRLDLAKQGKHIPRHPNYIPGRSILAHPDPQSLIDRFAGTGQILSGTFGEPGFKEHIDFGEVIGEYIDPTGVATLTSKGILHYSQTGVHIVPARP
jgi:hypothetical protein